MCIFCSLAGMPSPTTVTSAMTAAMTEIMTRTLAMRTARPTDMPAILRAVSNSDPPLCGTLTSMKNR
jgi:hypothetical protein